MPFEFDKKSYHLWFVHRQPKLQEFKNIDRFNAAIKFALCMRRIARKTVRGKPTSYMMTTVGLNDLKKYGVTE